MQRFDLRGIGRPGIVRCNPMSTAPTMTASRDTYYYDRAEAELGMAQKATKPEAVRAHYEMANRYLDLFYNPDASGPEQQYSGRRR